MAQRRRRKNRRWLGKILFLMLVAAAIIVCYFVWDSYFKNKETEVPAKEPSEVVQVVEEKEPEKKAETIEKEKVEQYDGEDPNTASSLTGAVTYAGVIGGELVIRVNIDQYLAGGECTLSLLQDGAVVYTDTVEIIDSASTATCAGFNVLKDRLGSGDTGIRIELNADGKNGVIAGEVEL